MKPISNLPRFGLKNPFQICFYLLRTHLNHFMKFSSFLNEFCNTVKKMRMKTKRQLWFAYLKLVEFRKILFISKFNFEEIKFDFGVN